MTADSPAVGLVAILAVLVLLALTVFQAHQPRRRIQPPHSHVTNVHPLVKPYDWADESTE